MPVPAGVPLLALDRVDRPGVAVDQSEVSMRPVSQSQVTWGPCCAARSTSAAASAGPAPDQRREADSAATKTATYFK